MQPLLAVTFTLETGAASCYLTTTSLRTFVAFEVASCAVGSPVKGIGGVLCGARQLGSAMREGAGCCPPLTIAQSVADPTSTQPDELRPFVSSLAPPLRRARGDQVASAKLGFGQIDFAHGRLTSPRPVVGRHAQYLRQTK